MTDGWNAAEREREILQLRAERDAADEVARTARLYVAAMEEKLFKAVEALRPFAWYFDVNDCEDWPDHGNAIEVPIRDLRAAFDAFKTLGLKVSPVSGDVGNARHD